MVVDVLSVSQLSGDEAEASVSVRMALQHQLERYNKFRTVAAVPMRTRPARVGWTQQHDTGWFDDNR